MAKVMQLIETTTQFIKELQRHFKKQLVSAVLFGSVARQTVKEDSDVDLLLVIQNLPKGRLARRQLLEPFFEARSKKGCNTIFNCHLKTPKEAEKIIVLYYDFPTDAKILHDTKNFFKKIIEKVARHIQKTGAIRKKWGKFYYWDLKPGAKATDTFDIL